MSSRQLDFVQKRRSTRIYNAVPLAIQGSDAFRAPYLEEVSTLTVNCHGCRYRSKYEVIQGDTVYLEVKQSSAGSASYSCLAEVKWVQRLVTKDSRFEIAVELKSPGNVWGIVSPPEDWFPIQGPKATYRDSSGQGQSLVRRFGQQVVPMLNKASAQSSTLQKKEDTSLAFVDEREHLLVEFRAQLQNEAAAALENAISQSKEELMRRLFKELNAAHEAAAQVAYERWNKKIQQDTRNAEQFLLAQAVEISRRIEGMTVSALERLQGNMEASRTDAIDRFMTRLRERLAPLQDEVQASLQKLAVSGNKLKDESQAIRKRLDNFLRQETQKSIAEVREKTLGMLDQFDSDVAKKMAECQDQLQEKSAEIIAETNRILSGLPENCEESVEGQLRSILSSAADDVTKALKEKTFPFSR